MREGACIGAATMLQPWTLRLTLNAAALAAASPTLLFRPCSLVECRALAEFILRNFALRYNNRVTAGNFNIDALRAPLRTREQDERPAGSARRRRRCVSCSYTVYELRRLCPAGSRRCRCSAASCTLSLAMPRRQCAAAVRFGWR